MMNKSVLLTTQSFEMTILGAYINIITLLNCPKLDWNLLESH